MNKAPPNSERLTFEQREGAAALPTQLKLGEVSNEFRALIWRMFDGWIERQYSRTGGAEPWLDDRWKAIMRDKWFNRDHRVASFSNSYKQHVGELQSTIRDGSYLQLLGLLEWFLRHPLMLPQFGKNIAHALEKTRLAYRVVGGDTIMPMTSSEEAAAVESALGQLDAQEIGGAGRHLRSAAEHLRDGRWADSVRESVHAVEATARALVPDAKELGQALNTLEASEVIHQALKRGFGAIYGYASDEKGVRHPLILEDAAKVDEVDALFMIGACASFVSYLLGKARKHGILA